MISSYRCVLLMLFHVMLISVANIENDCKENTMNCQSDGSAYRNVYQFFGDSSCQPNIKQYIEDAINTVLNRQNKCVETSDESIKALTAKIEALEKKIDELCQIGNTTCPNGYAYYQQDKFWYKFHNECKSWSEARQVCQQEGGDLISLNEDNFNFFRDVARSKAGDCSHVWVGTTDISSEGQWYWLNGERVSTVFWQPAQPDNALSIEHCGDLINFFEFRLNDHVCSYKEHFLCQIV